MPPLAAQIRMKNAHFFGILLREKYFSTKQPLLQVEMAESH